MNPFEVAPRAGAWIETVKRFMLVLQVVSPPVRGRGLKPIFATNADLHARRPPCGGVD